VDQFIHRRVRFNIDNVGRCDYVTDAIALRTSSQLAGSRTPPKLPSSIPGARTVFNNIKTPALRHLIRTAYAVPDTVPLKSVISRPLNRLTRSELVDIIISPSCQPYYRKSNSKTISTATAALAHLSSPSRIPKSLKQLELHPDKDGYLKAKDAELDSMINLRHVFDPHEIIPTVIPHDQLIPSKLIFDRKVDAQGNFVKFKCRMVARGDRWFDPFHSETYAATIQSESVKIILQIAACKNMELSSLDVKTAFLYPDLPDDCVVYMG
jgi:hypothetical protein